METIGQALIKSSATQSSANLPTNTQRLSPAVLLKTQLVRKKYGDEKKFLLTFNPGIQKYAGRHPDRAFFGEAPTLVIMRKTYGEDFPGTWLMAQILDLVAFSNSKGTLSGQPAEFLADAIANEYYYLKASELLLFFYRFKTGAYGKFYGNVDPMMIMQGLQQFIKERNIAIDEHQKELERIEREKIAENSITLREFCRNRGIPETDDINEALKLLNVKPPSD